MISQTTDYAIRAVVALAQSAPESLTTEQIAEATKVPKGYLSKVLQQLARKGIVVSRRGVHGGYGLARPADQMTMLPIIETICPLKRIDSCPLNLHSHATQRCSVHDTLNEAACAMESVVASKTIAELLADTTRPTPLRESKPAV